MVRRASLSDDDDLLKRAYAATGATYSSPFQRKEEERVDEQEKKEADRVEEEHRRAEELRKRIVDEMRLKYEERQADIRSIDESLASEGQLPSSALSPIHQQGEFLTSKKREFQKEAGSGENGGSPSTPHRISDDPVERLIMSHGSEYDTPMKHNPAYVPLSAGELEESFSGSTIDTSVQSVSSSNRKARSVRRNNLVRAAVRSLPEGDDPIEFLKALQEYSTPDRTADKQFSSYHHHNPPPPPSAPPASAEVPLTYEYFKASGLIKTKTTNVDVVQTSSTTKTNLQVEEEAKQQINCTETSPQSIRLERRKREEQFQANFEAAERRIDADSIVEVLEIEKRRAQEAASKLEEQIIFPGGLATRDHKPDDSVFSASLDIGSGRTPPPLTSSAGRQTARAALDSINDYMYSPNIKDEAESLLESRKDELERVYREFDIDGIGEVGEGEMFLIGTAIGMARRKLGQESCSWTYSQNLKMLETMHCDTMMHVSMKMFVAYFLRTMSDDSDETFSTIMKHFLEAAQSFRNDSHGRSLSSHTKAIESQEATTADTASHVTSAAIQHMECDQVDPLPNRETNVDLTGASRGARLKRLLGTVGLGLGTVGSSMESDGYTQADSSLERLKQWAIDSTTSLSPRNTQPKDISTLSPMSSSDRSTKRSDRSTNRSDRSTNRSPSQKSEQDFLSPSEKRWREMELVAVEEATRLRSGMLCSSDKRTPVVVLETSSPDKDVWRDDNHTVPSDVSREENRLRHQTERSASVERAERRSEERMQKEALLLRDYLKEGLGKERFENDQYTETHERSIKKDMVEAEMMEAAIRENDMTPGRKEGGSTQPYRYTTHKPYEAISLDDMESIAFAEAEKLGARDLFRISYKEDDDSEVEDELVEDIMKELIAEVVKEEEVFQEQAVDWHRRDPEWSSFPTKDWESTIAHEGRRMSKDGGESPSSASRPLSPIVVEPADDIDSPPHETRETLEPRQAYRRFLSWRELWEERKGSYFSLFVALVIAHWLFAPGKVLS